MSDNLPPDGDEPTQAWRPPEGTGGRRPFEEESEPTRLERPVPPYDPNREPAGAGGAYVPPAMPYAEDDGPDEPDKRGIAAQLVTVGLLCILLGIGIGYLLFHGTGGSSSGTTSTSTTAAVTSTTSTTSPTTTSTTEEERTTTTRRSTTTSTSTARSTTSSSSVRSTTTTAEDTQ